MEFRYRKNRWGLQVKCWPCLRLQVAVPPKRGFALAIRLNMFRLQKWLLISLALLGAPMTASAQTALIFERAEIRIDAPAPSEADKDPKPQHPMLKYNVELRAEDALRLEYIHALNLLTADTGVLITFASPGVVPLPVMTTQRMSRSAFTWSITCWNPCSSSGAMALR